MTDLQLSAAELYAEHSGNDEFLRVTAQGEEAQHADTQTQVDEGGEFRRDSRLHVLADQPVERTPLEVGQATSRGRMQASSVRTDTARIPFRHLVAALREADKIAAEKRDAR